MLSLVSSLAEELNVLRFNFMNYSSHNAPDNVVGGNNTYLENKNIQFSQNTNLIPVSDDEEEDDSDSDTSEDLDETNNEGSDDEESNDEEDDAKTVIHPSVKNTHILYNEDDDNEYNNEVIEIGDVNDIKVLKVDIESSNNEIEEDEENDLADFDVNSVSDLDTLESASEQKPLKTMNLKSISLEENEQVVDYKKMSLQRLRTVVAEKGLLTDSSKLKKHELLKLLGVE
jgi:hypothetical protein